jgi:hypothetical protein
VQHVLYCRTQIKELGKAGMNRRIIIGCAAAAVISLMCLVIGGLLLIRSINFEEPTEVDIQVVVPETVPLGELFTIEIQVTNWFTDVQTLDSIDFSTSYLSGISVQESTPLFSEAYEVPAVDFYSYTFNQNLNQGVPVDVMFVMLPEEEGSFIGVIDVCINSGGSCLTFEVETAVGDSNGR